MTRKSGANLGSNNHAAKIGDEIQVIFQVHKKFWIGVVLAVMGIAAFYFLSTIALNRFLQSSNFRDRLSRQAAEKLNADCGFLPLSWSGLSVHSEGFSAQSPRYKGITKIQARGIDARCGLMSLWHGTVVIHELFIEHFQVASGEAAGGRISNELSPLQEMKPSGESGSFKVDVQRTKINSMDIFWGDKPDSLGGLKNVLVTMKTAGTDLDVEGKGGMLLEKGIPDLQISRFQLYYSKPNLVIKDSSLHFSKQDDVSITGQLSFGDKSDVRLDFKFKDCPVAIFLPEKWRRKFSGEFSSRTKVAMMSSEMPTVEAEGDFGISHATLQGMAAQYNLASLTHKPQFEHLTFSKLACDYAFKKNTLQASNFVAEVEGLFVVKGFFAIQKEQINANLRVGVKPSVIEGIPGARERVFIQSEDGYLWTHVKVTGPLKHPNEDLSPRLLAAAKEQIFRSIFRVPTLPGMLVLGILGHLFDEQ